MTRVENKENLGSWEQTVVILKPDAVERDLTKELEQNFLDLGLVIKLRQTRRLEREIALKLYGHYSSRVEFPELIEYITSGECVVLLLEGPDAMRTVRNAVVGEEGKEGMREKYGAERIKNLIHGSDSKEAAEREIEIFFPEISRGQTESIN